MWNEAQACIQIASKHCVLNNVPSEQTHPAVPLHCRTYRGCRWGTMFRCRFKVSDGYRCAHITSSTLSDRWRQQRRHSDGSEAERSRGKWSRDDGVGKKKKKEETRAEEMELRRETECGRKRGDRGREDKLLTKSLLVSWRQWRVQRVISAHLTESVYSDD